MPETLTSIRWHRVLKLLDASPSLGDLRAHRLHLLAARQWRAGSRPVPAELVEEEIRSAWRLQAARRVLERVRSSCDGPLLLVKGPAVAARYPDPASRPFIDIDLLVPDAEAVQADLLDAGFGLAGDPADYPPHLHHLQPVYLPSHPIPIEVHTRLKWPDGLAPPTFEELARTADADALGIDGVSTPSRAAHTLVLAGHMWAHDPLTRLLRVLDVAVMSEGVERAAIRSLAQAWGMDRLWRTTEAVCDALFGSSGSRPWPLRTWARALPRAREATVLEVHASRLLSPFAMFPPAKAVRALGPAAAGFALPLEGEPWHRKLQRTAQQVAHPSMRRSAHVEEIDSDKASRRSEDTRTGP